MGCCSGADRTRWRIGLSAIYVESRVVPRVVRSSSALEISTHSTLSYRGSTVFCFGESWASNVPRAVALLVPSRRGSQLQRDIESEAADPQPLTSRTIPEGKSSKAFSMLPTSGRRCATRFECAWMTTMQMPSPLRFCWC